MTSLAEIRAKLQQQDRSSNQSSDNAIFTHWNIPEGSTVKLRFLNDADVNNPYFWIERSMIRLPFNGVKGQGDSKVVVVQVPCMEMWGETCPVLTEVRPWFKDSSLEELGRKYWKKRSYLFQGFVRDCPMAEDNVPENPIRRFVISPQIFNVIKASLMDPEIEELPTDNNRGLDFSITKTSKGGYSDYSTSKWARRESPLTEEELEAINTHGLFDLKEFLPKKPSEVEVNVIKKMFEASVDGQAYDPDLWGQYFKPYGLDVQKNDSAKTTSNATDSKPVTDDTSENGNSTVETTEATTNARVTSPVESTPTSTDSDDGGSKTADILKMIRERQSS